MSGRVPLGRKADLRLELKGRDALEEPHRIARDVVAFLNEKGGEVWVGLREENGRAVAVEPIPHPEAAQRRLLDDLMETVEPRPTAEEIQVDVVEEDGGGALLRVRVRPDERRKPYAYLRRGGRHFVVRIAGRVRPMSREEILPRAPSGGGPVSRGEQAQTEVRQERDALLRGGERLFWLRLEPTADLDLDLRSPELEALLSEPERAGNQRGGLSFSQFKFRPEVRSDQLVTSEEEEPFRVKIRRAGGMTFSAPLEALYFRGDPGEIWPRNLHELPVSALRLAAAVYRGASTASFEVVLDLALLGLEGWRLRPGAPGFQAARFLEMSPPAVFDVDDFLLDRPLVVEASDLARNPEAVGRRLVGRVYEAFGLRREQIPHF